MRKLILNTTKPLTTPVLFLVFNRLETTEKVFAKIKQARPSRLYVASDGPRATREGESLKVDQVRKFILSNIDWDCEVRKLFSDDNQGCGKAVSSAIDWFFQNEEMGIVLEDDCEPSLSFFYFCESLLKEYEHNSEVMQINGSCFLDLKKYNESYYFSKYPHIWGWATWRRAWDKYQFKIENFENRFDSLKCFNSYAEKRYWKDIFNKYNSGQIDTWDYPWIFANWTHGGLSLYPVKNMIKNIGFGPGATHTTIADSKLANLQLEEFSELILPEKRSINISNDIINFKEVFKPDFKKALLFKIKRVFSKGRSLLEVVI